MDYSTVNIFSGHAGRLKIFLILIPWLTLAALAIYFGFERCKPTYVRDGVKYTRSICGSVKKAEKSNAPENKIESKGRSNEQAESNFNSWEIIDTNIIPPFPTGLKFFEKDVFRPTAVRWNNYLIGVNVENYADKAKGTFSSSRTSELFTPHFQVRSIRAFNIDTGETFDVSLDKPTWGEIWTVTSQVVGNTYYFGVGAAFGPKLGYKLTLPPQRASRITKLTASVGDSIEKIGNIYISRDCFEGCTYSLFNPVTSTTTPLERMNKATNERDFMRKEEFVGIDGSGRMILNLRVIPQETKNQEIFETESIAAVPLNDEKTTITLLKASDLPEKINQYLMVDGLDKLLMLGQSKAFVYDFKQSKFTEVQLRQALKDSWSAANSARNLDFTKTDKAICFADTNRVSSAIDLTTNQFLDTPPGDCKKLHEKTSKDEMFKKLNLPENFKLVFTPITYKSYEAVNGVPESDLPEGARDNK